MTYRTGSDQLDDTIEGLITLAGETDSKDVYFEIMATVMKLIQDKTDRADLKMLNSTFKELRYSMKIFHEYRDIPKVTVFGSVCICCC